MRFESVDQAFASNPTTPSINHATFASGFGSVGGSIGTGATDTANMTHQRKFSLYPQDQPQPRQSL